MHKLCNFLCDHGIHKVRPVKIFSSQNKNGISFLKTCLRCEWCFKFQESNKSILVKIGEYYICKFQKPIGVNQNG